jgi:hypothetical protein
MEGWTMIKEYSTGSRRLASRFRFSNSASVPFSKSRQHYNTRVQGELQVSQYRVDGSKLRLTQAINARVPVFFYKREITPPRARDGWRVSDRYLVSLQPLPQLNFSVVPSDQRRLLPGLDDMRFLSWHIVRVGS